MKKIQENFFLPAEVAEALRPLLGQIGVKRKWMVYTAALIGFLKRERAEQEQAIGRVGQADISRDFHRLLREEGVVKRGVVSDGENGADVKPKNHPPGRSRRKEPDGRP
jgi:hypothetical protein